MSDPDPDSAAALGDRVRLFRSVTDAEYASIQRLRCFSNPAGVEVKYFTLTRADAERYAVLAEMAYGEGPFMIVETSIRASLIDRHSMIVVDGGIQTVVLGTALLSRLSAPIDLLRLG